MKTLAYGVACLTRPLMNVSSIRVFVRLRALSDKRFHNRLDILRSARIRRCFEVQDVLAQIFTVGRVIAVPDVATRTQTMLR